MWAIDVVDDNDMSVTDAALPSASLACSSTTWSYSACSFHTTFTPALHSSEPTDENGILPPILDTGATHCLLPLQWLTNEQSLSSKKIRLEVASGATVRALLYQNVIYGAIVSRPLISVGQLKTMLDLRMVWGDLSPTIHACSGGLRYILMEASVYHNLDPSVLDIYIFSAQTLLPVASSAWWWLSPQRAFNPEPTAFIAARTQQP